MLFPQTRVDSTSHPTSASGSLPNGNGCWDWIGWYGSNFAQRAGAQQAAIKAMVDQLSSAGGGGGRLPAPTGVTVSSATSSSVTIGWSAVSGAVGYNVYRNAGKANTAPVTSTSFVDTGLAAGTQYTWTVVALGSEGSEGALSAPVTATTGATRPRASRLPTTRTSAPGEPTRALVTPTRTARTRTWACGTCS